jgi:predicted transcriptional regulator
MSTPKLHRAQIAILRRARRSENMRYSDLLKASNVDNDSFKFHLKTLVDSTVLTKNEHGLYSLSPTGKEFANNLDREKRTEQKQPKLSVVIIVKNGDKYLFQKRLRNPFWGHWGFLSGPVRWGVEPETAAAAELKKQAGLKAEFEVKGFLRKRDYSAEENLLEDKQFIVVQAIEVKGKISSDWSGGENAWMTVEEVMSHEQYFSDTVEILAMLKNCRVYKSITTTYSPGQY